MIEGYKVLENEKILIVKSVDATEDELKYFHSSSYLEFLNKVNDDDPEIFEEEQLEYGLGYDCPILEKNFDFVKAVAGGSLTAAKLLNEGTCRVGINWFGGWHHAQRYFLL